MVKMLMIMYHIAFCTPCIALFNGGHLLHKRVDHVELESGFQPEQVQGVFGGPQVPSARILTLILDQGKPRCI
jgi:hypothetical protein